MFSKWWRLLRSNKPRRSSRPRSSRAIERRSCLLQVEALEARYAPAVTVSILGGVLTAQCDSGFNVVNLDHAGSSAVVNGQSFADATYNTIRINGGVGGTIENIRAIVKPLTIFNAHDGDTVNVGSTTNTLDGIQENVNIQNPPAWNVVNVNDQGDTTVRTLAVVGATIGGSSYEHIFLALQPFTIDVKGNDTRAVNIRTGIDGAFDEVYATLPFHDGGGTALIGNSLNTIVDIGHLGTLQYIQGPVSVSNPASYSAVNVDDSADTADRTVTLSPSSLIGLGPAAINYQQSDLRSLNVHLGNSVSAGNKLTVTNTPTSNFLGLNTTITTGTASQGEDDVSVLATTGPLTVNLNNDGVHAASGVHLGSVANTLDDLRGYVEVDGLSGRNDLDVTDQGTAAGQGYGVFFHQIDRYGGGSNQFAAGYQGIYVLSFHAGSGANHIYLEGLSAAATDLYAGLSNDLISVDTLQTHDYLAVQIANPGSQVVIDDQGNSSPTTYTFRLGVSSPANEISSSTSVGVIDLFGPLQTLVFDGGAGNDTYDIETLFYNTTINAGGGGNCFHVSPVSQQLGNGNIAGSLTLNGGGNDVLDFFDTNNPMSETYTFDATPSSLTLATAPGFAANWTGMGSVYLETNGMSTVNDDSGSVFVDVPPPS